MLFICIAPSPTMRDHRAIGMGELGGDRIRHARAHRGEAARQRRHHPAPDIEVARIPVGADAAVAGEDGAVGQPGRKLGEHALRVDRVGLDHRAVVAASPPIRPSSRRSARASSVSVFCSSSGSSASSVAPTSPCEIDFHRIADREHARLDIDLHAARLPFLGQELGIGKTRAEHQAACRIPSSGRSSAWCRAARSSP